MALARLTGPLSFQKSHKLHLGEVGSKLVAVILVLQPGMTFDRWPAIQNQAGRTAVMLDMHDGSSQPVRVGFLRVPPGVGSLLARPCFCAGACGTFDRVGIALVVLVLALVVEVLAQQLDRSARDLLGIICLLYTSPSPRD